MEFVATFYGANRLKNSTNGNPRWRLRTSVGVFVTQSDSAVNYDVNNFLHSSLGLVDKEVRFTTTKAGHVWRMEPA